jgi:hypothetical protein
MMSKETGKAIIDLLFKMWDDNNNGRLFDPLKR